MSDVACIRRSRVDLDYMTWCGKDTRLEPFTWTFVDVSHAAENGDQQGRILACARCVAAIQKALKNGRPNVSSTA